MVRGKWLVQLLLILCQFGACKKWRPGYEPYTAPPKLSHFIGYKKLSNLETLSGPAVVSNVNVANHKEGLKLHTCRRYLFVVRRMLTLSLKKKPPQK